jgi:hypothetical protein
MAELLGAVRGILLTLPDVAALFEVEVTLAV